MYDVANFIYSFISGDFREFCDQSGITKMFGEYRARCLHSKAWILREACISKIMMILNSEYHDGDATAFLPAVCGVLRLGAEDKIQQVLFNSLTLMEQFVGILKRCVFFIIIFFLVYWYLTHLVASFVENVYPAVPPVQLLKGLWFN